jgi:hypothetical protein
MMPQPFNRQHDGARLLWRHWNSDRTREGFVREYSPSGEFVRISDTPRKKDKGHWHLAEELRVLEVIDHQCDFAALEAEAKAADKAEQEENAE